MSELDISSQLIIIYINGGRAGFDRGTVSKRQLAKFMLFIPKSDKENK